MTVPEVTVWKPGSIWCQVTVEPAVTVSFPGLYAMSLRFTVSPAAAAPVVVVVFAFVPDDEDASLDEPHPVSTTATATSARTSSASRMGLRRT